MKQYHLIPIIECKEPLVPIPTQTFSVVEPHPYVKLGAPYGARSPYFVRYGILERLLLAHDKLQQERPDWKIQIFDAYRPVAVQRFMVNHTLAELAQAEGLNPKTLNAAQRKTLLEKVYEFWAPPSTDAHSPPPHSTGAAVDVTLINAEGQVVNMGSPIDEASPRSYPDHFAESADPQARQYHGDRALLHTIMSAADFCRHPNEWWHFSYGDQMWAWVANQKESETMLVAQYGRVD